MSPKESHPDKAYQEFHFTIVSFTYAVQEIAEWMKNCFNSRLRGLTAPNSDFPCELTGVRCFRADFVLFGGPRIRCASLRLSGLGGWL